MRKYLDVFAAIVVTGRHCQSVAIAKPAHFEPGLPHSHLQWLGLYKPLAFQKQHLVVRDSVE
jgi:hypothetical protein